MTDKKRITIARVKTSSKYLDVWSTDTSPDDTWDYCFRNGWLDECVWSKDMYDDILTYGMKGLVIDLEERYPKRILGRQSMYDRIPAVPRANAVAFPDEHDKCVDVRICDTSNIWIRSPMSKRLLEATKMQREDYRFIGDGIGIKWGSIDEHLSVKGIVRDAIRWWMTDGPHRG